MRGLFTALIWLALAACRRDSGTAIDRLQPCKMDDGPVDAYCGKLSVWENRETKQGRKIELKIVVLPALRRDPQADPVFFFAGGPGQGAAQIAGTLGTAFRRLQNDRDLVMVDQRGTGDSHPLKCEMEEKGQEKDDLEEPTPAFVTERFRSCLAGYDADPRQYTTPVAMDDIDEVRRYLGYGEINLWGGSYGTRAALVYLRRHESSVRSAILDGVAPTDMRLPLFMARDSQRALDLMLAACEQDPQCAAKFPALRQTVQAAIARADTRAKVQLTHPRTGKKYTVPLSPAAVRSVIFSSLYVPAMAALLPRLLHDAAQGDFQGLIALGSTGEGGAGSMAEGMFLSVVCAEDMPHITPADIERASVQTFFGKTFFETRMKACEFWPKGTLPANYHQPVVSAKPVLILSGEADPVTPPEWGERVRHHLKNSRHIVVPGAGHGVSAEGCVPKLLAQFLSEASPAQLDTACVQRQQRPPFFVNYSGPEVAP